MFIHVFINAIAEPFVNREKRSLFRSPVSHAYHGESGYQSADGNYYVMLILPYVSSENAGRGCCHVF